MELFLAIQCEIEPIAYGESHLNILCPWARYFCSQQCTVFERSCLSASCMREKWRCPEAPPHRCTHRPKYLFRTAEYAMVTGSGSFLSLDSWGCRVHSGGQVWAFNTPGELLGGYRERKPGAYRSIV